MSSVDGQSRMLRDPENSTLGVVPRRDPGRRIPAEVTVRAGWTAAFLATLLAACVEESLLASPECSSDADCLDPQLPTCTGGACAPCHEGGAAAPYFTDADSDGHGTGPSLGNICRLPAETSFLDDDCDDADAGLHPGAPHFRDADGDGVPGTPAEPGCVREPGDGDTGPDCDDEEPSVYPDPGGQCFPALSDAITVCAAGCTTAAADAQLFGDPGDSAGVVAAGDLDGDGWVDLAIGGYAASPEESAQAVSEVGVVYVAFGPIRRGRTSLVDDEHVLAIQSPGPSSAFGGSLLILPSASGDGHDLLIGTHHGEPEDDGVAAGSAYLIHGAALLERRSSGERMLLLAPNIAGLYTGIITTGRRSLKTLAAGDLDGDGRAELVLGSPIYEDPSAPGADRGAVYVVPGACTGTGPSGLLLEGEPEGVPSCVVGGTSYRGAKIVGARPGDKLGKTGVIGDLDGAPPLDLVLGASAAEGGAGAIYGFLTLPAGVVGVAAADLAIPGSAGNGLASAALPGDLDLDGAPELVVSGAKTSGAVVVLAGPVAPGSAPVDGRPGLARWVLPDPTPGEQLTVAALGDVTGDGVPDLALCDDRRQGSDGSLHGSLALVSAPFPADGALPARTITSASSATDHFCTDSALSADLDRDGVDDLVVADERALDPVTQLPGAPIRAGVTLVFFGPSPRR